MLQFEFANEMSCTLHKEVWPHVSVHSLLVRWLVTLHSIFIVTLATLLIPSVIRTFAASGHSAYPQSFAVYKWMLSVGPVHMLGSFAKQFWKACHVSICLGGTGWLPQYMLSCSLFFFTNFYYNIPIMLKSGKNNRHFTWKAPYICVDDLHKGDVPCLAVQAEANVTVEHDWF